MADKNAHWLVPPFTAARLQIGSEENRNTELTLIGIRWLKREKLMAWDGRDMDRALELATIAYNKTLAAIEEEQVPA